MSQVMHKELSFSSKNLPPAFQPAWWPAIPSTWHPQPAPQCWGAEAGTTAKCWSSYANMWSHVTHLQDQNGWDPSFSQGPWKVGSTLYAVHPNFLQKKVRFFSWNSIIENLIQFNQTFMYSSNFQGMDILIAVSNGPPEMYQFILSFSHPVHWVFSPALRRVKPSIKLPIYLFKVDSWFD